MPHPDRSQNTIDIIPTIVPFLLPHGALAIGRKSCVQKKFPLLLLLAVQKKEISSEKFNFLLYLPSIPTFTTSSAVTRDRLQESWN
jgi:hypothetical protein